MRECNQNNLRVSELFGMSVPCSAKYLSGMSVLVLLEVATKGCFRGEKN